jgi:hypothetical protein
LPYYRLYHLNPKTGHIDRFNGFEVEDDGAAVILAEKMLEAHPLELWQQHRKVQRFDPPQAESHLARLWRQHVESGASLDEQQPLRGVESASLLPKSVA